MKGRKILLLSLLGTLLISLIVIGSVEAKSKYKLKIINKAMGQGDVYFIILSEDSFDIDTIDWADKKNEEDDYVGQLIVGGGDSDSIKLEEGTYWIYYEVCGRIWDGKIKLEDDYDLVIHPCANRHTKMRINNHFGETITINFDGYDEYEFDVEFGKNRVELFSGNYSYNYDACDTEISGEIYVTKDGKSELTLHNCEWYEDPARIHGPLNPVKYKIINHASFPLIMTLIGPENYLVTADPGVNILQLVAGSYKFSYYLDYQTHSGSMFVPKHGNGSLIVRPAYVIDNGLPDAE